MGYIESLADAHLHDEVAHFHVRTGPRFRWRVDGMERPPDLTKVVRQALYEEDALERGRDRLLQELRRRGHLRAEVPTRVLPEDGYRTLVFAVNAGPVLTVEQIWFPGASAFSTADLTRAAGGAELMVADPRQSQERVRQLYRENHYLKTKVGPPEMTEHDHHLRIVMAIDEGPRARLREVRLVGSSLPPQQLSPLITIEAGDDYDPLAASETVLRLRDRYLEMGYPSVRVSTSLVPRDADLELLFQVTEGPRMVVGDVVIKGLRRTRESLVRRQVTIERGQPLDPRDLSTLERRVFELGVFSRAVVTASEGSPATITIEVEEQPRYLVAYDLRYNPEEKGSALVDAEVGNLFGHGWTLGARHRRGRGIDEWRGSFHVPSLFRGADLTLSAFRLRDDLVTARELRARDFGLPIEGGRLREQGVQVQQALHFLHPWAALYGYSYRRVYTRTAAAAEWTVQDVGGVDVSVALDTRDTAFASTRRGTFLGVNLEVSPKVLGSDFNFVKAFAQFSLTRPLNRTLTWAQGYRLGVGFPFDGGRLVAFERFRAGGANSIRGYATDSLGPLDELGQPGGEAVAVMNQEVRYLHPIGLGAAVFYDAGNVFGRVPDIELRLRHAVGIGLRYDSAVGLIRVDLGLPLNRRPGEERYQLFFGLGEAF
jgi:outer membrane protein assembly complex protein YaeT